MAEALEEIAIRTPLNEQEPIILHIYLRRADSAQYDGNSNRYHIIGMGASGRSQESHASVGFASIGKFLGIDGIPSLRELIEHNVNLEYHCED